VEFKPQVYKSSLDPVVANTTRVGPGYRAWEHIPVVHSAIWPDASCAVAVRKLDPDHAQTTSEIRVHVPFPLRELVDQEYVNLRTLVREHILGMLAMAEVDHRTIREPDFLVDDPASPGVDCVGEKLREA